MSKFYINPTTGGDLQKQFGAISETTNDPLGFGSANYRRRLRSVVDQNPVPIRPRGGVTRVVGVKELTYDNELLIEVEILVDQNEYAVLQDELYGGLPPGATLPQFSSVDQLILHAERDPTLRDYMRNWPIVGYQHGSVPTIRGLLDNNDLTLDQWEQIIDSWRTNNFAVETNADGSKLHARFNEKCPLCRKRIGMYTDSVQRKILQKINRQPGKDTPGWSCGWPVRPIELSHGPKTYVGVAPLTKLAKGQYYSKSWIQYHMADLANVVVRIYNEQIIQAVKNRFEQVGLEPNSPLGEIVYGPISNPRIEVVPPEDMDPRFFTKVSALQHNIFTLPDFVAVALQSTYYTFNALVKLQLDKGPRTEELGGEPPSFIQFIQHITNQALGINTDIDPLDLSNPWDTVLTKSGKKVNIYQIPLADHSKIPIDGLNFLFDAFTPTKYSPARRGPIDWGIAGRSDNWFVETSADEIFGLEDKGVTLVPWAQNAPFPIDDAGNLYVCDENIDEEDVSELSFIYDEPNRDLDRLAAERIRHMLRVMPTPEELEKIKQAKGPYYTDFTGRFGKKGVQYDWSHPALWLDVEEIAELEVPPPYVDNEGRYIPLEAFPKVRELYGRLNNPQTSADEKKTVSEEIRRIYKGYVGNTYTWEDITGYDPNTETNLRPKHPVVVIPAKGADTTFKSILADARFDQWLISDPTLVRTTDQTGREITQWDYSTGAGCEFDEAEGVWRARYIDPQTRRRIPWSSGALWSSVLADNIESIGEEEIVNARQSEQNVIGEIARLVPYVPDWEEIVPEYYIQSINSAAKKAEPLVEPENAKDLLHSYITILNKCRSTMRSIKNTVQNAKMDPAAFRIARFETPVKLPEELGWEHAMTKQLRGTGRSALIPWSKDWLIAMMQRLTPTGLERFGVLAKEAIKDRDKLRAQAKAHGAAPEDLRTIEISTAYKRRLQKLFRRYSRANPAHSGPYVNFKQTGIIDAPEGYGTKLPPFRHEIGTKKGQAERASYFAEVVELSTTLFKMIEQGEFLHRVKTVKDPDFSTLADLQVKELTGEIPSARHELTKQFTSPGDLTEFDPGEPSPEEPEETEPEQSEPDEPEVPDEDEIEFEPPQQPAPRTEPEEEEPGSMRPFQMPQTPFNTADLPSEPEDLSIDDYGHEEEGDLDIDEYGHEVDEED